MIDTALPPLPFSRRGSMFRRLPESFALSYLARYNTQLIQPRVLLSFQRAYGVTDLKMFPRVVGSTPGWVMARWVGSEYNRVTIAIEGMSSLSQLWTWANGLNSDTLVNTRGRVLSAWAQYAASIRATLEADDQYNALFGQRPCYVTFAGWSMGAAVAEVLATRYARERWVVPYGLFKFASPRVGTYEWRDQNRYQLQAHNFYVLEDPIHFFPYTAMAPVDGLGTVSVLRTQWYVQDDPITRYDQQGRDYNTRKLQYIGNFIKAAQDSLRPLTESNDWRWHNINHYRYAITELAQSWGGLDGERFRYLEFNDNNNWGPAHQSEASYTDTQLELVDPQPAEKHVVIWQPEMVVAQQDAVRPRAQDPFNELDEWRAWGADVGNSLVRFRRRDR